MAVLFLSGVLPIEMKTHTFAKQEYPCCILDPPYNGYRYLIAKKHLVFYVMAGNTVQICGPYMPDEAITGYCRKRA